MGTMLRKGSSRRRRPVVHLRARDISSQVVALARKHGLGLVLVALPFALVEVGVEQVILNAYPRVIHDLRAASLLAFYGESVVGYLAMAAIALFAWPRIQTQSTTLKEPFNVRQGLTLAALALAAPFGIVAGLVVAIVPGIIMSLSWCVAPATAAVRGESVRGALRHSARLTRGSRSSLLRVFAAAYGAVFVLSCVSAMMMGRSLSEALFDPSLPTTPDLVIDGLLQVLQLAFNGTVSVAFFAAALKAEQRSSQA